MDHDETRAYIEHRLKCAGFSRDPLFNVEAYEAIHKASGGIPRRINSLCDRLLLSGFLAGKTEFLLMDVEEVAKELNEETLSPAVFYRDSVGVNAVDSDVARLTESGILDVNLSRLELDASTAEEASRAISELRSGITDQRLVRLERSMIRIERSSAATLALLQQLVNAVRIQQPAKEDQS